MVLSINDLPEELLIHVFSACLMTNSSLERPEPAALALVCKGWHGVVYGTPSLWTLITWRHSPTQAALALDKSRSMPIDILFLLSSNFPESVYDTFSRTCDHIERWKEAAISFESWRGSRRLLARPAPHLETIDIHGPRWCRTEVFMNLFRGQAPRLKHVRLGALAIPWNSGMLADLVTLDLAFFYARPPSIAQLLAILRASPQLVVFRLRDCKLKASPSDSALPTASLPSLRHVTLLYIDAPHIGQILSHIQSPPCDALAIGSRVNHETELANFDHLPALLPASLFGPALLLVKPGSVTLKRGDSIGIKLKDLASHIILRYLTSIAPPRLCTRRTKIQFDTPWDYQGTHTTNLVACVEAADIFNITELGVLNDGIPVVELFERLGTPRDDGTWLLPGLEELELHVRDVPGGVLTRMVEARHVVGKCPTRLNIHRASEEHDDDRARLEAICGVESLIWNDDEDYW